MDGAVDGINLYWCNGCVSNGRMVEAKKQEVYSGGKMQMEKKRGSMEEEKEKRKVG